LLAQLSPLRASAAPVGFPQALASALNRWHEQAPAAQSAACAVPLEDFSALAAQLVAANEIGLPPAASLPAAHTASNLIPLGSRSGVLLCAALLYSNLEAVQTQRTLLADQQKLVARLLYVESRRVSADVDPPLELVHAKLLRARIRMQAASLEAAEQKARLDLAALADLPPDSLDTAAGSMPALPDSPALLPGDEPVLRQLLAYQDIVQLDYAAEYATRLRAAHDMELGSSSLGALLAAHITEQMKFQALLRVHQRIRVARLQMLAAHGALEAWAQPDLAKPPSAAEPKPDSKLLSLLVAPIIDDLPQGKSQQLTAIATDANGHARDVSAESEWTLSRDSRALVSSTGLLTALSPGRVTLTVRFGGLSQFLPLTLQAPPPDEFLIVEKVEKKSATR
jgi:hypothetical protein